MIVIGNANQWFTEDPTEVPTVELLCDVKTRWDSAYFMINRMHALHLAIDHFLSLPRGSNDELSGLHLTALEWEVLQDLKVVLEIPHEAQQCMSSESRPVLSKAVPAFETVILWWRALVKNTPHCGAIINAGLDQAEQYYQ
ncbi:hypothetical protein PISMIDRAFT_103932 [Pisolithus microcarpus 441]|uniref:Uncharacterized protein n=1 Tax=Pisolithus microcarpus 441 TaxID=765257 RepID=A0A0C9YA67_9AGAM|nr:hypothetical protein PISMIDRAFT_103932 [Pisolithus microcarpus 441]